jgi:hypothetical protein
LIKKIDWRNSPLPKVQRSLGRLLSAVGGVFAVLEEEIEEGEHCNDEEEGLEEERCGFTMERDQSRAIGGEKWQVGKEPTELKSTA